MLLEGEQSIGLELVDFIDTGREQHGKAVHIQCRSDTANCNNEVFFGLQSAVLSIISSQKLAF